MHNVIQDHFLAMAVSPNIHDREPIFPFVTFELSLEFLTFALET